MEIWILIILVRVWIYGAIDISYISVAMELGVLVILVGVWS